MTIQHSPELDCPRCRAKQSVTLYDSINVSLDPSLKERLFKGKINTFRREKSQDKVFVPIPLLYHSMGKHLLVQFYPFEAVNDGEFLKEFSKDGEWSSEVITRIPRKLRAPYKHIHIVFDTGELVRYVIFRDKLSQALQEAS